MLNFSYLFIDETFCTKLKYSHGRISDETDIKNIAPSNNIQLRKEVRAALTLEVVLTGCVSACGLGDDCNFFLLLNSGKC